MKAAFRLICFAVLAIESLPILDLSALAQAPHLRPQANPVIWSDDKGDDIRIVPCSGGEAVDELCAELSIRQAGREIKRTDEGFSIYNVQVDWRRAAGGQGPDVVVSGGPISSWAITNIYSITFGAPTPIQDFEIDHVYPADFHLIDGAPAFFLTFSVPDFAFEPNSETAAAPVAMRWTGSQFDADLADMKTRGPSTQQLDDMRRELMRQQHSLEDRFPSTVQALLEMILAGEAIEAKRTLDADWTGDATVRDQLWGRLCARMVDDPLWKTFGLDGLNGADVVKAAATL